jgi:hypothetical protein
MKRSLLVLLLAAVVLGTLAAPAVAAPAPALKAPFHAAFIVPNKMGGLWLEATGDVNAPTLVPHAPGAPIPADYDVYLDSPWRSITLGLAQTVPSALLYQVHIDGLGVDVSPTEAMKYWSGPVLWDAYWSGLLGPIPAFNATIGAAAYANHWWLPLTGETSVATANLTAGKKLVAGTYAGTYTEIVTRTITDLKLLTPDQTTPVKRLPGTTPFEFTFTVAAP